jgi:hypothetical protein
MEVPEISRFLGSLIRMYYREHPVTAPHVVDARHLGGHRVWLRFDDGLEGAVDLAAELWGEVFEPLRDPVYFARFAVDDTLVWPNGADFAPAFLHACVAATTQGAALVRPARLF